MIPSLTVSCVKHMLIFLQIIYVKKPFDTVIILHSVIKKENLKIACRATFLMPETCKMIKEAENITDVQGEDNLWISQSLR